ncbi:conserved hypothetical protein [Culex quinquefasciatus]|uniref:EF-hand domain-containing protein n=1 Tax=Culex quinquefasciatus TaxID=7176 RepID=B0XCI7_CULQU|nr:conserved hypothetical protein [Culex quinquefasciatus]|eukprot:XP_001867359.1 conserved hypothetical protein [Culex quinquefasciatus]
MGFAQDCPNGKLTPAKFVDMYKMFFPSGNAEEFCDHVFRTFDMDKNGYIDFKSAKCPPIGTSPGPPATPVQVVASSNDRLPRLPCLSWSLPPSHLLPDLQAVCYRATRPSASDVFSSTSSNRMTFQDRPSRVLLARRRSENYVCVSI